MAGTAAHRVFAIAELTRLILNNVDSGKDLFSAQGTCRMFNDHVKAMLAELTTGSDTAQKITEGNATINPFLDLCYTRLPCDAEDERYFVVRFAQAVFAAANSDASPTPQLPLTLFATQPPRNKLRLLVYRINKPKLSSPAEIHRYWEDHCRPLLTLGNPVAFVYRDLERMTADRSSKRQEVLENETGVTLKDILQNLGPSWISMAHRMVTIVPDTGSDACDEAMVVLDDAIEKSKGSTSATAISGI